MSILSHILRPVTYTGPTSGNQSTIMDSQHAQHAFEVNYTPFDCKHCETGTGTDVTSASAYALSTTSPKSLTRITPFLDTYISSSINLNRLISR
jgi:hypothetical protein